MDLIIGKKNHAQCWVRDFTDIYVMVEGQRCMMFSSSLFQPCAIKKTMNINYFYYGPKLFTLPTVKSKVFETLQWNAKKDIFIILVCI